MAASLVNGNGSSVDARVVAANTSMKLSGPSDEPYVWNDPARCSRAVHEY